MERQRHQIMKQEDFNWKSDIQLLPQWGAKERRRTILDEMVR